MNSRLGTFARKNSPTLRPGKVLDGRLVIAKDYSDSYGNVGRAEHGRGKEDGEVPGLANRFRFMLKVVIPGSIIFHCVE